MGNRAEQKENRRNEIIAIGLDLFIKKGYAATKITDIAEAAKMSAGLLFHYYESKEKLYEDLIRIGVNAAKKTMLVDDLSPLSYFEKYIDIIFDSYHNQPWTAKMFVLLAQARHSNATPLTIKELANQIDTIETSTILIKQGQAKGEIRNGDPLALSIAFWGSVTGIMEILAVNENYPVPSTKWLVEILKK